jgi:hypothetical protein
MVLQVLDVCTLVKPQVRLQHSLTLPQQSLAQSSSCHVARLQACTHPLLLCMARSIAVRADTTAAFLLHTTSVQ